MARNSEKAQAMLNRFIELKKNADAPEVQKRPFLTSEVHEVPIAEKWRGQVIREISKAVSEIQNASLGEHKIRDLNDRINKLLREKYAWEKQIVLLGGPNYAQNKTRVVDADGRGALGQGGYYYFGAAKELPGVRELFERADAQKTNMKRGELYKCVDAQYYGYHDDDDGLLISVEKKAEEKLRAKMLAEWQASSSPPSATEVADAQNNNNMAAMMKSHVDVPTQQEMEAIILEKKKQEILKKYAQK